MQWSEPSRSAVLADVLGRVLMLLTIALIAFGITVVPSSEPEHAEVEGLVRGDVAIVANWFGGSGLWYVYASAPPPRRGRRVGRTSERSPVVRRHRRSLRPSGRRVCWW